MEQRGELWRIYSITSGNLLDVVVTEGGAMAALESWAYRLGFLIDPTRVTIGDDGLTLIFGNVAASLA